MKIGFTGNRHGLSAQQGLELLALLVKYKPAEVHHGDCIGADEALHKVLVHALKRKPKLIGHPSDRDDSRRAYCSFDETREPLPYLKRNHAIVDETDVLFVAPDCYEEVLRSGSWATVRYARKKGTPLVIVWPNGTVTREPDDAE